MSTLFGAAHLLFGGISQLCLANSRRFQRHIKSILMDYPLIEFMATGMYLTYNKMVLNASVLKTLHYGYIQEPNFIDV